MTSCRDERFTRTRRTPLHCTWDETFNGLLSTHGSQPGAGRRIVLHTNVEHPKALPVADTSIRCKPGKRARTGQEGR